MLVHIAWCMVAVVALFIGWSTGVSSGERTAEDEVEAMQTEIDALQVIATGAKEADQAAARWRKRYFAGLKREESLRQMVDRLLPSKAVDLDAVIPDPPSIRQADQAVLEERRAALMRADMRDRIPIPITDDDVQPPFRLTEEVYGDG